MTSTRRDVLAAGVGVLAGLAARAAPSWAQANAGLAVGDVAMLGTRDGGEVWFDPVGIRVAPGTTLRWTNGDAGNAHTATAYHPANGNHPLRIPAGAEPWDSGYLLPGMTFLLTLTIPGVYDYFCRPHQHAGMVGRIGTLAAKRSASACWAARPAAPVFPTDRTLPSVVPWGLASCQSSLGPLRDQPPLLLGEGGVEMEHEGIGIGTQLCDDERDALGHQAGDEGNVTRQAVQLGDNDRAFRRFRRGEGGRELWAPVEGIVAFAGLGFDELGEE